MIFLLSPSLQVFNSFQATRLSVHVMCPRLGNIRVSLASYRDELEHQLFHYLIVPYLSLLNYFSFLQPSLHISKAMAF